MIPVKIPGDSLRASEVNELARSCGLQLGGQLSGASYGNWLNDILTTPYIYKTGVKGRILMPFMPTFIDGSQGVGVKIATDMTDTSGRFGSVDGRFQWGIALSCGHNDQPIEIQESGIGIVVYNELCSPWFKSFTEETPSIRPGDRLIPSYGYQGCEWNLYGPFRVIAGFGRNSSGTRMEDSLLAAAGWKDGYLANHEEIRLAIVAIDNFFGENVVPALASVSNGVVGSYPYQLRTNPSASNDYFLSAPEYPCITPIGFPIINANTGKYTLCVKGGRCVIASLSVENQSQLDYAADTYIGKRFSISGQKYDGSFALFEDPQGPVYGRTIYVSASRRCWVEGEILEDSAGRKIVVDQDGNVLGCPRTIYFGGQVTVDYTVSGLALVTRV